MAKAKVSHQQETQKSDQQLGTLLAAVLAHPETPEGVYNSIGDALAELQSQPGLSTRPESIQAVIDAAKQPAATAKAEPQKSDQPSTIANRKFLAKAKAAVEEYEQAADKEAKSFTFTEEEFETLEQFAASVFDLNKSLGDQLSGNGEGLNYCLWLVAHDFDNLVCDVREREEKKGGGAA